MPKKKVERKIGLLLSDLFANKNLEFIFMKQMRQNVAWSNLGLGQKVSVALI